ncbi:Rha family transcriptional regulator [Salmonella enterica subsp. enterica serovar Javiana]|nr:Rha family transcriptional regulator [Salmonella enterica subsp. enterica serovar Javiana]
MTALDRAIKIAGGIRPLGRAIGAYPSQIHKWVHEYNGRVPTSERVFQIYLAIPVRGGSGMPGIPVSPPDKTIPPGFRG